jgi:hypothetical protein
MRIRPLLPATVAVLIGICADAAAQTVVIATETARAEYEDGVFTAGRPEFRFRFEIDEARHTARLTETVRLRNGAVIDTRTDYTITAVEDGSDLFSISKERLGQRALTLVGKPGALATEMIVIGETYFEYSKVSAGRLYLASGTVQRPKSVEQDSRDLLRKSTGRE